MTKPAIKPCSDCPWRKSNQDQKHKGHWYTKKNLNRLWAGLRTGSAPGMTCHPTDPSNPLPDGMLGGAPKGQDPTECAGALLLIIRELKMVEKDVKAYTKTRKKGLTKDGIAWWALSRCVYSNTPFGGPPIPMIEEDADIVYDGVGNK